MYFDICIVCVNTIASMIKTNFFFFDLDPSHDWTIERSGLVMWAPLERGVAAEGTPTVIISVMNTVVIFTVMNTVVVNTVCEHCL